MSLHLHPPARRLPQLAVQSHSQQMCYTHSPQSLSAGAQTPEQNDFAQLHCTEMTDAEADENGACFGIVAAHQPKEWEIDARDAQKSLRENKWHVDWSEVEFGAVESVGEGSTGVVLKARFRDALIAVKVPKTSGEDAFDTAESVFEREFSAVSHIKPHANVALFLGTTSFVYCDKPVVPLLMFEFLGGGSLDQVFERETMALKEAWAPPSHLCLFWCHQLSLAVQHLHEGSTTSSRYAHRDIKLDNLLLTMDLKTLKLADFSLAIPLDSTSFDTAVGSLRYLAPEAQDSAWFDLAAADIFSASMTMWAMLHGTRPFPNTKDAHLVAERVRNGVRPPIHGRKWGLRSALQRAWNAKPYFRLSARELVDETRQALERLRKETTPKARTPMQRLSLQRFWAPQSLR